ncbi:MAG: ABC transporter ATP-binding protein [Marinobacterium sp.]|nr:ABC transporter ATP-binding protein [Marinobacterium sp.]
MTLLKAEQLSKGYHQHGVLQPVLSSIELDLQQGEIVLLFGPSGEGKSTLLHLLAGLIRPDKGEIWFENLALSRASEQQLCQLRRQRLALVFQFFNLIPTLTVAENLQLSASLAQQQLNSHGLVKILKQLGLAAKAAVFPQRLSGGEQQRVAIARALVTQPRLILADEPTGNLDRDNAERVMTLFIEQVRKQNCTLLLATHDPTLKGMADRCLMLEQGVLYER